MIEIYIYLTSNLFATYILYRFMGLFFDRTEKDSRIEIVAFLAYYTINSTAYLILSNPLINLISTVVMFFLITHIHEGKTRTRILATLFTYVTAMLVDSIVCNVINAIVANEIKMFLLSVPSNLILFMVVLILEKLFKKDTSQEVSVFQIIAIIAIPAGSVSILVTLFIFGYNEVPTVIVSLVLLTINFVTFYLYDEFLKYYTSKYENEILTQQNKAYRNQFEIINGAQKNISILRHDMKNHIIAIGELASGDGKEDLKKYLESLSEALEVEEEYVRSGNKYIDSILNYKISEAKKEGIEVDINIAIPEEINIQPFDLSVILGNLFDNAVEAVRKLSRKTIRIDMKMDKSVLFIRTLNPYAGVIEKKGDMIISTKDDVNNHGFGLKSVQNSIKKYDGLMEIDFTESIFEVNLLMYN